MSVSVEMGWRSAISSENVHTGTPEKRMQEAKSQVAGHQQDSGKFGNTAVHCSRCSNQITTEGAQQFFWGRGTVSWSIQPTDLAKVAISTPVKDTPLLKDNHDQGSADHCKEQDHYPQSPAEKGGIEANIHERSMFRTWLEFFRDWFRATRYSNKHKYTR
jgi:hypothetical protein